MNPIIEEVVSSKYLAIVGVSDKKFGGTIYRTLKNRGYTVYPVHPSRASFDGDPCFSSLRKVPDGIKTAVVAVSPATAEQVIDDAVVAGLTHLWFQQGKDFSAAVAKAQSKGLKTVNRKCILMYAQPVTGGHAFHRFIVRLFGRL